MSGQLMSKKPNVDILHGYEPFAALVEGHHTGRFRDVPYWRTR